jgi:hypothetical protein
MNDDPPPLGLSQAMEPAKGHQDADGHVELVRMVPLVAGQTASYKAALRLHDECMLPDLCSRSIACNELPAVSIATILGSILISIGLHTCISSSTL